MLVEQIPEGQQQDKQMLWNKYPPRKVKLILVPGGSGVGVGVGMPHAKQYYRPHFDHSCYYQNLHYQGLVDPIPVVCLFQTYQHIRHFC